MGIRRTKQTTMTLEIDLLSGIFLLATIPLSAACGWILRDTFGRDE